METRSGKESGERTWDEEKSLVLMKLQREAELAYREFERRLFEIYHSREIANGKW